MNDPIQSEQMHETFEFSRVALYLDSLRRNGCRVASFLSTKDKSR